MENAVKWIVDNWDNIPDNQKRYLKPTGYTENTANIEGLKAEEHFVVMLLDRQKPSVVACYDFDEERIGVTKSGKVVYGFDSGCSCPSPWNDSYPDCYSVKEWKEFILDTKNFDEDWEKECLENLEEIKKTVN